MKTINCFLFAILLFGVLTTAVVGCTMGDTQNNILVTPMPASWLVKWLEEPMCELPCWEGIQPGEKMTIPYPSDVNIHVEVAPDTEIVKYIALSLSKNNGITISKIISNYGSPDYVRTYICNPDNKCDVHIIFIKKGMVVSIYTSYSGNYLKSTVSISADATLTKIYFFEPDINKYYEYFNGDSYRVLLPWLDYGIYSNP